MTKVQGTSGGMQKAIRLCARAVSLFAAGLFLLFVFESGARVIPALAWSDPKGMPLFLVLTLTVTGAVVGWGSEVVGGLIAVVGSAMIVALVYLGSGPDSHLGAFLLTLPLVVAGILYLASCWWDTVARAASQFRVETSHNEQSAAVA